MGEMIAAAGHHVGGIVVAAVVTIAHDAIHHVRGDHHRKVSTILADGVRAMRKRDR